jgi:uncharacterized protein YbaA (DUF1428 family)
MVPHAFTELRTRNLRRSTPAFPIHLAGANVIRMAEVCRPQAVKLHDDEVVVSSWAVYESRDARDRANKAIMEDKAFQEVREDTPVDMKRMFMGGFKVLRGM